MNCRRRREGWVYSVISWFDELDPSASALLLGSQARSRSPRTSFLVGRRPIAGSGEGWLQACGSSYFYHLLNVKRAHVGRCRLLSWSEGMLAPFLPSSFQLDLHMSSWKAAFLGFLRDSFPLLLKMAFGRGGWEGGLLVLQAWELMEMIGVGSSSLYGFWTLTNLIAKAADPSVLKHPGNYFFSSAWPGNSSWWNSSPACQWPSVQSICLI